MIQFSLRNWTTVLFGNYDLTNKLQVATTLDKATTHIFDGEPVILPIPDDAPSEIPRIILASKNQRYRCQVATNRLEYVYDEPKRTDSGIASISDVYFRGLGSIVASLKGELKTNILRLGLGINFLGFPEDPVLLIKNTFVKDDAMTVPAHLQLHILNRLTTNDNIEINKWTRVLSLDASVQERVRKVLSVVFQIDTVPEKRYDFSSEFIVTFYSNLISKINNDLSGLFPSEK